MPARPSRSFLKLHLKAHAANFIFRCGLFLLMRSSLRRAFAGAPAL